MPLSWTMASRADGELDVQLEGEITENAHFEDLLLRGDRIVLNFDGVRRINSHGVRQFVDFLRTQPPKARIHAEYCRPAIVLQLGMVPELAERLVVRSLFVPFECEACLGEDEVLMQLEPGQPRPPLPAARCKKCKKPMHLSEPEERYFAFLR